MNGFVARQPPALVAAVVAAIRGGAELRRSTLDWYARTGRPLSIEGSLAAVEESYRSAQARS